jgi:hypothetical protein
MEIQFTKGHFISLRAAKKVHLGAIEMDVYEGDELEYDGQTLKMGGKEYNVPNLRAGIRAGWFTVDASVPRNAAGPAAASSAKMDTTASNLRKGVSTIEDDERQVGFATQGARDRANTPAPASTKTAASADEGVAVGKVRFAAKQHTVLTDSSSVNSEISRLDNMAAPTSRRAIATGDVQEAASGDELEDLLPELSSTGRPAAGPAGAGHDGMTVEERADAVKRARLAAVAAAPAAPPVARAEVTSLAAAAESAEDDVENLFGDLTADPEAAADTAGLNAAQARMSLAKLAVPGFEWNLAAPWRSRVKIALEMRNDPVYMNAIFAVETDTVKKHVAEGLRA